MEIEHSSGKEPRDIVPNLYRLAWRKNKSVCEDILDRSWTWTRGLWLWRMNSVQEMAEFVQLWGLVQDVQLNDQEDQIIWKCTGNGEYTPPTQLLWLNCTFDAKIIWKGHAEGKV